MSSVKSVGKASFATKATGCGNPANCPFAQRHLNKYLQKGLPGLLDGGEPAVVDAWFVLMMMMHYRATVPANTNLPELPQLIIQSTIDQFVLAAKQMAEDPLERKNSKAVSVKENSLKSAVSALDGAIRIIVDRVRQFTSVPAADANEMEIQSTEVSDFVNSNKVYQDASRNMQQMVPHYSKAFYKGIGKQRNGDLRKLYAVEIWNFLEALLCMTQMLINMPVWASDVYDEDSQRVSFLIKNAYMQMYDELLKLRRTVRGIFDVRGLLQANDLFHFNVLQVKTLSNELLCHDGNLPRNEVQQAFATNWHRINMSNAMRLETGWAGYWRKLRVQFWSLLQCLAIFALLFFIAFCLGLTWNTISYGEVFDQVKQRFSQTVEDYAAKHVRDFTEWWSSFFNRQWKIFWGSV